MVSSFDLVPSLWAVVLRKSGVGVLWSRRHLSKVKFVVVVSFDLPLKKIDHHVVPTQDGCHVATVQDVTDVLVQVSIGCGRRRCGIAICL